MIRIKKLSTKMLIGLGVVLLSLTIFQVIVTQRVKSDRETLRQSPNLEQMLSLLNNRELKTYRQYSVGEFSRINILNVQAQILKGDRFAVYASDYYRLRFEISVENDELTIGFDGGRGNWETRDLPVFIVMPTEPKYVLVNENVSNDVGMFGFSGEETVVRINNRGSMRFQTDMPNLNIIHRGSSRLNLVSASTGDVQLLMKSARGQFSLTDINSSSISANIQMFHSSLSEISIHPQSSVGTLSVHGIIAESFHSSEDHNRNKNDIHITHNGQVDSLHIQLTNILPSTKRLILSPRLSGRYENIDVSDNIVIERR